jgi:arylsulfatase A-like enzyme
LEIVMRGFRHVSLLAACLAWGSALEAADATRPNIIVILSDDMGYSDLGCYGGEIATPNLDSLAANGVRFTQFYNAARCCPTRASLLTGLYPHQAGVGHMTEDRGRDGYRGVLNRQSVTIPEVLRPAGYRTYMCGKWHLTRFTGQNADRSTWPLGRGFEKFYGTIVGAGSFYDPSALCRQDKLISVANDPDYRPESYYYTDALSDNAVSFLRQHRAETPEKPFFLYVAYTAAHWPMHAPKEAIEKYKGRFDSGYAPVREGRLGRMKEIGLIPPSTELSPASDDWADVKDKAWEARCKEVFAAMIETMDAGIGRIVAQLKASDQWDNTLILFLQDNGACAEKVGRSDNEVDPGNLKPMRADQLQPRGQPPMQTRDGRWVKTGPGVMPGPADTYIAYGRGWANVSNTPFREYKHWTHEGGISTPLIAHWPASIRGDRAGRLERQPGHLIDIMATCVDLAGASYPEEVSGQTIKPREGVSLRPAFNGEPLGRTQPLFWEHESNRAVREGDWKLVAKEGEPWELYNIATDRIESHNLAASEPSRTKELAAKWDAYAARANVLPLGTWRQGDPESGPLSDQKRFALKSGDHLERIKAPAIQGRPFTIEATITVGEGHADGVIVAQGATAQGFSLFLKEGRPHFVIRVGDVLHAIEGPRLTPGEHIVTARLGGSGTLTLEVDRKSVAEPVPGKLLARMPTDGLDVGRDNNGAVGPYSAPFPYPGEIKSVVIDVDRR